MHLILTTVYDLNSQIELLSSQVDNLDYIVAVFFFCHSAFIIISVAYRIKAGQVPINLEKFIYICYT